MVDSLEEYIIELEMDGGEDTAKSSGMEIHLVFDR